MKIKEKGGLTWVTEVMKTFNEERVNELLKKGWVLIGLKEEFVSTMSGIVTYYVLGR